MKILNRGAEAVLTLETKEGEKVVVKERVKKGYRIQQLDEAIRKQRTRAEVSIINKARRFGILVPRILEEKDSTIVLEYIEGQTVKDSLNNLNKKGLAAMSSRIGETIATLHSAGIIHGDLTTSNMIISKGQLYLIDFGLSKNSSKVEDQATDLYLLYEAIRAAHFKVLKTCWGNVLNAYIQKYTNTSKSAEVIKRLEAIGKRRRYKTE